jgi:hypothetical protein
MKIHKFHLAFFLALFAVGSITTVGCHQPDTEKVGTDVKTTAQDTATAAKDAYSVGKDKAVELATNTEAILKQGVQKAGNIATNVAADVKSITTNVADKVDQMVH